MAKTIRTVISNSIVATINNLNILTILAKELQWQTCYSKVKCQFFNQMRHTQRDVQNLSLLRKLNLLPIGHLPPTLVKLQIGYLIPVVLITLLPTCKSFPCI